MSQSNHQIEVVGGDTFTLREELFCFSVPPSPLGTGTPHYSEKATTPKVFYTDDLVSWSQYLANTTYQ
jgi:hypothetical protein